MRLRASRRGQRPGAPHANPSCLPEGGRGTGLRRAGNEPGPARSVDDAFSNGEDVGAGPISGGPGRCV